MAPQPTLMFWPSGAAAIGSDLRAELLERLGRDARVRAVRTVDRDPQAAEVGPEPLDDVLEVAVGGDAHAVDRAGRLGGRRLEERFDLLLGRGR